MTWFGGQIMFFQNSGHVTLKLKDLCFALIVPVTMEVLYGDWIVNQSIAFIPLGDHAYIKHT